MLNDEHVVFNAPEWFSYWVRLYEAPWKLRGGSIKSNDKCYADMGDAVLRALHEGATNCPFSFLNGTTEQ